jgi:hypothetical protein
MPHLSRLTPICALVAVTIVATAALAESTIGGVSQREYRGATGAPTGAPAEPIYFANDVFSGETVATPPVGGTVLQFKDQTELRIGSNSTVVLDHFVYDPQSQTGDAAINFSKGIFRFVTGDIKNKDNVKLTTPTATLTIRGTDFKLLVTDDGTVIRVYSGYVEVHPCGNSNQARVIGPDQAAKITSKCDGVQPIGLGDVGSDSTTDGGAEFGPRGNPNNPPAPPSRPTNNNPD